ncbi:flagellar hook capping FlgD N-terminal domain-containing protein [Bacillus sp. FJAT-29814]|uniref:flagellar hook capping FlgD N-terminal domain-containing protein n=1 Tax=Bacillus sp. FJAT-29814 TaxID=1729688 RepID=UPI00082F53B9|nr:flagellar hook capping FlgD N-terminal domain-containing protein [Bacillus sp. FJAT-29814]
MPTIDTQTRMQTAAGMTSKQTKPTSDPLGKDVFLKLLTTQLKNQDPTQPMEDREFIVQLAQFSMLEQMSNLNQAFNQFAHSQTADISQYSHMINKEVSWLNSDTGLTEGGQVNGVIKKGTQFFYQIKDQEIPVETIVSAKDTSSQNG